MAGRVVGYPMTVGEVAFVCPQESSHTPSVDPWAEALATARTIAPELPAAALEDAATFCRGFNDAGGDMIPSPACVVDVAEVMVKHGLRVAR